MAKFFGMIGYAAVEEISPGVHENVIIERAYYGDVIRDTLEVVGGDRVVSDRKTANAFRIISDGYADDNFFDMVYVTWRGTKWAVRQVEVQNRPRLLVRIGGVYHGPTAGTSDASGDGAGEP